MEQMAHHVLAILNQPSAEAAPHVDGAPAFAFADPGQPHLSVLDLGATRGDGIFESISVGNGRPQALEHHLRRFASSAAKLELPAPDLDAWRSAILASIEALEPGTERVSGPFANELKARMEWQRLTFKDRHAATERYAICAEPELKLK